MLPSSFLGIPVVTSEFLVIPDPDGRTEEVGYRDWRERLTRWLAQPSHFTRRDPLTFQRAVMVPDPHVYLMQLPHGREQAIAHPKVLAKFKL